MEENLNNEAINKSSKKKTILISVILTVIVLIVIGILLYLYIDKKNKDRERTNNAVKEQLVLEENIESLLEENVPFYWTYEGNTKLYMDKKVMLDDLSQPAFLDKIIGKFDDDSDKNITNASVDDLDEKILKEEVGEEVANLILNSEYRIPLSAITDKIYELYNYENYNINNYSEIDKYENYSSFDVSGGTAIIYDNNVYIYYGKGGGGNIKESLSYTYEKDGDQLYVYEKILILDDGYLTYSEESGIAMHCYNSQLENGEIKEISITDEKAESYTASYVITLATEQCKDYARTYKHTFKKNTNGEYYWYSTESYES
jgi:hypothetical protein